MTQKIKIILLLSLSIIGFIMYVALYFIVPLSLKYSFVKHLIMIIGYISVLIFPFSFIKLVEEIKKKKSDK